jgi:hypothetical protein
MVRNARRFIPRLEAFDDRSLPSVTASGGDLFILGDDTANTVVIMDDGAGNVEVTMDGQDYVFADPLNPITSITIQTFGGVDTVDYTLTGDLVGKQTVVADLGNRADSFTAHLSDRTLAPDSRLIIQSFGDGGGDHLTLDAQNVSVAAGASLEVDFIGGKAKDSITIDYTPGPINDGTVTINTDRRFNE